jgi:hypothetical protein
MRTLSRLALTATLLAAMPGMNAAVAQEQPEEAPGMMQGQDMMPMMDMMMQMSRMMEACTEMMQAAQPAPATPPAQPQDQP